MSVELRRRVSGASSFELGASQAPSTSTALSGASAFATDRRERHHLWLGLSCWMGQRRLLGQKDTSIRFDICRPQVLYKVSTIKSKKHLLSTTRDLDLIWRFPYVSANVKLQGLAKGLPITSHDGRLNRLNRRQCLTCCFLVQPGHCTH